MTTRLNVDWTICPLALVACLFGQACMDRDQLSPRGGGTER